MTTINVSQLPVDPGPAAWNCLLPDAAPARRVQGDIKADWIVIGAGFAGLAAARRLSQLRPTGLLCWKPAVWPRALRVAIRAL